jgi:hypothetical protein
MLCEAAADAAAPLAVVVGWAVLVMDAGEVAEVALAAEAGFTAAVWLVAAPPWGATTAESRNCERPSVTVTKIRSAVIVVPKDVPLPPRPATAASVEPFWNHSWPLLAYWPAPFR